MGAPDRTGVASVSSVCRSTSAPAVTSAGWVCSAMLCDSPPTLGVKIIAAGQMRASIWASWPAPLGIRRVEWPSRRAVDSTRSTVAGSKSTGSKRASERVATVTPSAAASRATSSASAASA